MYIRKLVKSGNSSLVVAVPKEWLERQRLKSGDQVYLDDIGEALTITVKLQTEKKPGREIVINVDGKSIATLKRQIRMAYINDYTTIILKGQGIPKLSKFIKEQIMELVALEAVDESSAHIVARNFLNIEDVDLKLLLRRMDNIIRSMIIDCKDIKNDELAENIIARDKEVNKLSFVVFKILKTAYLNKTLLATIGISELDILRYYQTNLHLEKIGDRVKYIASLILKLPGENRKSFIRLLTDIETYYKEAMKVWYHGSPDMAEGIAKEKEAVDVAINAFLEKATSPVNAQLAIHIFEIAHNVNDITRSVSYLSE